MLNFFPTLWFSIETVKDFAILLCHNKCFFSSYDMVLVHVHMRTFCKISLNHWTQLALISPNIIRKKKFYYTKHYSFHFAYTFSLQHRSTLCICEVLFCFISFSTCFARYIFTQTSKKRKCDHNSILWMRKLKHSKVQYTP